MSGPIFLVPEQQSHDLVFVLEGLYEMAKSGDMNGLVFAASFKGQRYYCDAAGALHRSSITALALATKLQADLERRLHTESVDTLI